MRFLQVNNTTNLPEQVIEVDSLQELPQLLGSTLVLLNNALFSQIKNEELVSTYKYDPAAHKILKNTPPPTIQEAKMSKKAEINSIRDKEELLPFEYLNKSFDADDKSIKRLSLAAQAAQAALLSGNSELFLITWTCADNTTIDLNAVQMVGILEAMLRRGNDLHVKARELKAQIDAATTAEEVEAVSWN